jgi:hypothetical protein
MVPLTGATDFLSAPHHFYLLITNAYDIVSRSCCVEKSPAVSALLPHATSVIGKGRLIARFAM